jgi:endonuclease/exonuclease/phosphatase family metal-dependent hydrolase
MRLFGLFTLLLISISLTAQTVKVMTYNIRLDTESDGVNQWKNRTEKVYSLIRKYNPDLFGVQEALHNQMMDLKKNLSDYDFIGVARDDGKEKGEYSAIFYKKSKYEVKTQNTFWLSETPNLAGSKSWDAAITRVATFAVLKEKSSGKSFLVLNTHFDHIGKEARKNSVLVIKTYMKGFLAGMSVNENTKELPIIITGDFNSEPTEEPYQLMIDGKDFELIDSRPDESKAGTFCSFTVNSIRCKTIDYIFHSTRWTTKKYKVITDNDGKYYPSDHLPVITTLKLKN